jgi:ankyrin repeat protein
MSDLPAFPDFDHLKKQAKNLLRDARAGQQPALLRILETLPAARRLERAGPAAYDLKLHDAQSAIAREYGFKSWTELKRYVSWKNADRAERIKTWLGWALEGNTRERGLAVRTLREEPHLFAGDSWLACTIGNDKAVERALARDPDFVNRRGGPLGMPPLVAVTHSSLIREPGFEAPLLACAKRLLQHGADPNSTWSDPRSPDFPLSALYGAAGRTHNIAMTKLLLEAGASPDDNESLYHSVESRDPTCMKMLLAASARVTGTNAIARVLDYDKLESLRLLLQHGGDANEQPWIHHAILRGRSLDHILALRDAGADLRATNQAGISVYRWAEMHGRTDIVDMLREAGIVEELTRDEAFVAACTRADETEARAILDRVPEIYDRLTPSQLQTLPRLADVGNLGAVRTMLALGWPREVKTAWDATALNLAVFRGDAAMAELLLEHGADWRTTHGFGDNVLGTLSWASQADGIEEPAPRDYVGCARVLVAHGVPPSAMERYAFSNEVSQYVAGLSRAE